jgi:DNA polymerase delta subunit 1
LACLEGYHCDPVTTFDFASLYPSLMLTYNLCPSTLIRQIKPGEEINPETEILVDEYVYVKNTIGIFPKVIKWLLEQRGFYKKLRDEQEKGSRLYEVYETMQQCFKDAANSMYGAMGFARSKMSAWPVASSITFMGRKSLKASLEYLQQYGDIVYGDTDSVMVKFHETKKFKEKTNETLKQVMDYAFQIGKKLNGANVFPSTMKMEMEAVKWPCFFVSKKFYFAFHYKKVFYTSRKASAHRATSEESVSFPKWPKANK